MRASRKGVGFFLKRYKELGKSWLKLVCSLIPSNTLSQASLSYYNSRLGTISRRPGSGRPSKITDKIKKVVEEQMRADDETTAHQLHALLNSKGFSLSLRTILRCRISLGWTFRGSAYCQLIREVNKQKRLQWAREILNECAVGFKDVIWSDEATVQLESHRRFCCRKQGEQPRNKPTFVCTSQVS